MSQYSSPKIWGPHFWYMLRCVANNYPLSPSPEDAVHVKNFFNELQYLLPCEICKYTYRQHINKNPIDKKLGSRADLIDWVEIIFEETKKVIGDKRVKILDIYEEVTEMQPIKKVVRSTKQDQIDLKIKKEIPLPPQTSTIIQPIKKPVTPAIIKEKKVLHARVDKTVHQLSEPQENYFGMTNSGKKIDTDAIKNHRNIVINNPKQKKKFITNFVEEVIFRPVPMHNNIVPPELNTPIPKKPNTVLQKTDKNKLESNKYVKPYYIAPRTGNSNNRELTLTRKCKKCEDN